MIPSSFRAFPFFSAILFATAASARADDGAVAPVVPEIDPATIVWVLVCAAFVFLMQPGFCMLELGFARAKNCLNVVMKNILDFCVAVLCFLFIGFGLMFGASDNGWVVGEWLWLPDFGAESPVWIFWIFQAVFVATAATIVSGAMAERTRFIGYLLAMAALSAFIYPMLGRWAWGSLGGDWGVGGDEGWLEAMGFADFAGSSVVHGVGGACALAGVLVVGPRAGRFISRGKGKLIPGHNLPFAAMGMFLIFFGWFGFNAGSALSAEVGVARIVVNTVLAAAAGGLVGMVSFWRLEGRPDVATAINGVLGGLVAITACCDIVNPASAVLIGAIAGCIASFGAVMLEKLHVDDVVGAVPVHLFNGVWGTLAVALFHEQGFSASALGIQALGTLVICGGAFVLSWLVFKLVDRLVGLRATDEEQEVGLDFSEHSATAYPYFHTSD